jgi:hypothetical protein
VRWKELVLEGAQVSKTALGVRGLLALLLSAFGIFGLWSGYAVVLLVDLSGALDLEWLSRRRYLSFLHATYSGGALVGTLVAGALLSAGVGYRLV